ncbi:hypothetical protein INT45_006502 [Circinella minor]|uniref:Uncharacterized protein n=1 Tax=Circinella minor TaxID=1195481 RepID=A0A8H7S1I1_9FUNG|nr:hypothetical protein INT45_006502 [Circinella minor]
MSTNNLYITTTTGITLSNNNNNNNNRHQQPFSLLTTRDQLIAMAQKEYARQLSKFTESQMKEKEYQRVETPSSALYTHHEQRQHQHQQQEQHYFNLPKTTKINNHPNFIHESSIYSITLNDTNKDVL